MSSSRDDNNLSRRPDRRRSPARHTDRQAAATHPQCLDDQPARSPGSGRSDSPELGAALQDAQQRMAGDELRQLSAQRRKTVDALARRAVELGREHGYSAPDERYKKPARRCRQRWATPRLLSWRSGRLNQAVTYGGFGPTDLASAFGAPPTTKAPSRPEKPAPPSGHARRIQSSAAKPRRRQPRRGSGPRPPARLRSRRSRRRSGHRARG